MSPLLLLIAVLGIVLVALIRVRMLRLSGGKASSSAMLSGRRFPIIFPNGTKAGAVYAPVGMLPEVVRDQLELGASGPALFIVGGAGGMSPDDIQRTQRIIDAIAEFAHQNNLLIIDGGTESGIMQMVGDARKRGRYKFPLIGVSPMGLVKFPGRDNLKAEAELEDSHTHFVLVEGESWGIESAMIQDLARCVSGYGTYPMLGMLINGGNVALNELRMAVERRIPMILLEGSGRAADQVVTAIKTGETSQIMIKQIMLQQADLQFIKTTDSPDRVKERLAQRYGKR
ncbi:MAG: hypothetical protein MUC99_06900 [Anaerolineae bacterium]|jgi:hypothetical protein|nr:hypothetical protein [Anaerolineae bacterium]